jgi:RNA polymerase sigma factor (sigma-70 family)
MAETTAHAAAERLAREAAFGRLVSRELAGAYRTASVPLGDGAEAEDATHDALVRAWQRWEDLNDPERVGAWFGRILINICRDRLRARQTVSVRWLPETGSTDATRAYGEREALWQALSGLTADHRIVIVLRYDLDLPLEAIAG